MRGRSVICLYELLLWIGLGISWSINAATTSNTLNEKIDQLNELDSWQRIVVTGEHIRLHPDMSADELEHFLETMGQAALKYEEYSVANHYFLELEALSEDRPDSLTFYTAIKSQGVSAYFQTNYRQAIKLYQRALEVALLRKKPLEIADIHSNLGLVHTQTHELDQAITHYVSAHQLYESHGDLQDKADIMLNLSGVYIRQFRYKIAEDMLLLAIKHFNELGDEYGVALTQANLGVIYRKTSRWDLSRVSLMAAIRYYEEIESWHHLSFEYSNLAELSLLENKIDQGLREANFGLYYAEQAASIGGRREALYPYAKALLAKGEYELAKQSIEASIRLAQETGATLREKDNLLLLSFIQSSMNEPEKALAQYHQYQSLQSKLVNNSLNERLEQYQDTIAEKQLTQEIKTLKQYQALQKLQIEQREQLVWLGVLLILSLGIAGVSVYRKRVLQHTKTELSRQVAQRTAQLQQVADELREANQVKSQFLANISHEIRTPLTSILGHTEALLIENQNDKKLQESLRVVHRQGEHLRDLICDVLDLSKIEALQFELELTEFEIENLIDDVSDMFQHACFLKGLEFIIHNHLLASIVVELDYIRLKQVLINLLGNAVKFTEQGRVELTVAAVDNGIEFVVQDTGIGMDEAYLQGIFNSFQQGDNSISRRFGGSGLGLSLSQQLVNMMGGKIDVESTLSTGSKFTVLIPCSPKQRGNKVVEAHSYREFEKLSGRILIAEDHDDNRALFSRLVGGMGPEVVVAQNGEQAVELCLSEFPDLVLMDIQMPKVDGLEAFKVLRQAGYDGPIYALTANVMSREIKAYLEYGFTGHIGKPINTHLLHQILAKHLAYVQTEQVSMQIDMSDLTASFLATLDEERYNIVDLWESRQTKSLQNACHRLAGAAVTFGLTDIAQTAKQLEQAIETPDRIQAQHLYLILCDELQIAAASEQLNLV